MTVITVSLGHVERAADSSKYQTLPWKRFCCLCLPFAWSLKKIRLSLWNWVSDANSDRVQKVYLQVGQDCCSFTVPVFGFRRRVLRCFDAVGKLLIVDCGDWLACGIINLVVRVKKLIQRELCWLRYVA